jgi:hypothetical protein
MIAQRYTYEINYRYLDAPRMVVVEAQTARFQKGSAARHLMHVHGGDATFQAAALQNSDLLENERVALDEADRLGIREISVKRLADEDTHRHDTQVAH